MRYVITKCLTFTLDPQQFSGIELLQELSVEAARLDGKMVQLSLLVALGEYILLDSLFADQAVDVHFTGLPDAVAPILSLQILC